MSHCAIVPQLIEVDPLRISLNPAHLRRHGGLPYLRLKKSLERVGIVQPPLVRILSAESYESVDGDGRVQFAQEKLLERIWVLSVGMVDDQTAALLYQESNASRSYNFLEECRGLATLVHQGFSTKRLAEKLEKRLPAIQEMVALGNLPEELITLILQDMAACENPEHRWSQKVLLTLLRLRQAKPGKPSITEEKAEAVPPEELYDYGEVRTAIEKILRREITQASEMVDYVSQRREVFFQQHFAQELQQQLQLALQRAHQATEERMQHQSESTRRQYEKQLKHLQEQLQSLESQYQQSLRDSAKQSDPKEIARRTRELDLQIHFTQTEREKLEALQQRIRTEAHTQEEQFVKQQKAMQQDLQRQKAQVRVDLQNARKVQQSEMDQKLALEEQKLRATYDQRDKQRQLKAETTVRQSLAYGTQLLTQAQQWLLHVSSPAMRQGVSWLSESEVIALIAQMRAVRESLEKVEAKMMYGDEAVCSDASNASTEKALKLLERSAFDESPASVS